MKRILIKKHFVNQSFGLGNGEDVRQNYFLSMMYGVSKRRVKCSVCSQWIGKLKKKHKAMSRSAGDGHCLHKFIVDVCSNCMDRYKEGRVFRLAVAKSHFDWKHDFLRHMSNYSVHRFNGPWRAGNSSFYGTVTGRNVSEYDLRPVPKPVPRANFSVNFNVTGRRADYIIADDSTTT